MFGPQQTFEDVLEGIISWIPQKAYGHESKFQNELQNHLDWYLNDRRSGFNLGMQQGDYVVSRERGKSRADVAVNDVVGIEMKRNLSNSQTKKLRGQIEEYLENYPYVIVCACGIDDMDGWRELKNKYAGNQGLGIEQQVVEFVHKRKEDYGKDPSEFDGGDGGFLGGGLFG